jgi:excisionase family DNA binding protein
MTFPLLSRSTQISGPSRFPVSEFEPLLDAIEAAALLRIHPNTLRMKARLGEIPGRHIGKYWRFRVSDLNDWVWRQERSDNSAANPLRVSAPHAIDASVG